MKEILFRGKKVDTGEWVEGYLLKGIRDYIITKEQMEYAVVNTLMHASIEVTDVISETVGQYTGLKDKKGVKIFEDDIVICDHKKGKVQFDNQQASFIILWFPNNKKRKSGCDNLSSTFPSPQKEIIGNIHNNSELIKKE